MKTNIKFFTIVILFSLNAAPVYSFAISADAEADIGREADKEISKIYDYYDDKKVQEYVSSVGSRLLSSISNAEFTYYFKVVKSSQVNAFALPGGYIYVTTGILGFLNSEAELAGVLGHEIGHVTSHHAIRQQRKAIAGMIAMLGGVAASALNPSMQKHSGDLLLLTQSLLSQVMLGYSREYEMESDRLGLVYLYNAGYNPKRLVYFLKNLKFQEMMEGRAYHGFFATHPDTKNRIIAASDMANSLANRGGRQEILSDIYLSHLKGLLCSGPKDKRDRKGEMNKRYIDIYTAQAGDTIKGIAETVMKSPKDSFRIAVINNKREDSPLKEGERIKIIVKQRPAY